jgi:hypothetical protein
MEQKMGQLIRPIKSVMASHPFARKKAKGWGTEGQYERTGSKSGFSEGRYAWQYRPPLRQL